MRISFLLLLASAASLLSANLPPLALKDVSLMLRSGYSSAAVEQEVTARHFLGAIDPAAEKALLQAGAAADFVASLKSGASAPSAADLAASREAATAKTQRRATQAEEARKFDTLYQARLAQDRVPAAPSAPTGNIIAPLVKGDLFTSQNGVLNPCLDQGFEKKKLIGLYFSGSWCPECRKFTPKLVEYYNRVASAHPEFEIVFVSRDRSPAAMQSYMRSAEMPWPAIAYDKIAGKLGLNKYAGNGIPCLVVVDPSGKVISDSVVGKSYRGPAPVLADLDQLFASGYTGQLALQR